MMSAFLMMSSVVAVSVRGVVIMVTTFVEEAARALVMAIHLVIATVMSIDW